jgi:pantoate--beta-alanine ligase
MTKIMRTIESAAGMQNLRDEWRGESLGFVPTMGALHEGHLALMQKSRNENSRTVVSIFVNPTQFNDPQDLDRYPRPIETDLQMLRSVGVDAVFLPQAREIYADGYKFSIAETEVSRVLCGPKRPGHFAGMLTVVLKLLNLVSAERAYFGEKDFQQLKLIQDMARAFFLRSEIIGCPTVREVDGLAMSSRNLLLTSEQRKLAPEIYRILKDAQSPEAAERELTKAGFQVDYVEEHWGRRFAAAFLGNVRLIDNVAL